MNRVTRRANSIWRFALVSYLGQHLGHVLVNEFPKSGGTWIAQMISRAICMPFPRNRMPGIAPSVLHGHYLHTAERQARIVVWRDGRDMMVSWYFHCLFENERDNASLVRLVRRDLPFRDYHDVIHNLPQFIEYAFTRGRHPPFSWAEFVRQWVDDSASIFVKYEDMRRDAASELQRITFELTDRPLDRAAAGRISDDLSFERMAGRPPGAEARNSFMRRGLVGEWRECYSKDARAMFRQYGGVELRKLGYEVDDGWASE